MQLDRLSTGLRRSLAGFHGIPPEVREELAQDALLRLLDAAPRAPEAWAHTVARNLAIGWLRRERGAPLGELEDERGAPDAELARDEARRAVWDALDAAPPRHRWVLTQLYVEGRRLRELANEAGDPRARARLDKQHQRALAWMRTRVVGGRRARSG